jgi:hypothetical protein
MSSQRAPDWTPKSIEDLADEALDGWEDVLPPALAASVKDLVALLYETDPTMKQFADEAVAASRLAPETSEQGEKNVKVSPDGHVEVKKKVVG